MSTDHIQPTTQSTRDHGNPNMTTATPNNQQEKENGSSSSGSNNSSSCCDSSEPAAAASPVSDKSVPKPPRGHRRQQASIGLGIITTSLDISQHKAGPAVAEGAVPSLEEQHPQESNQRKNNDFFSTSGLPLPRPPPPLSPRRERQDLPTMTSSSSPRRTLAPPPSVPSPIPNVYSGARSYSNDDIMPLPSPAPGNPSTSVANNVAAVVAAAAVAVAASTCAGASSTTATTTSSSSSSSVIMPAAAAAAAKLFPKQRVMSPPQLSPVTPDEKATDNEQARPLHERIIPAIVTSPTLPPGKKNKLPSLVDEPRLGDLEDKNSTSPASATMSEYRFPSPSPVQYTEENIVGKQIGEYRIGRMVGVGAFSKVYLATKQGTLYAVKMVSKKRIAEDARVRSSLEREVGVLKFIDHPSIVGLDATMETEKHLCIVLEFADGGELFDFVQQMHQQLHLEPRRVDEALVRRIFAELVHVVQWMHDHNVVHRDLKLENILIRIDDTGVPHLKVTDFGLARVIDPEAPTLTTRCGSEEYCAPEIVQGLGYDGRKTDTWALGVILYALLVGYLPFMYNPSRGEKVSHLFYRIISSDYRWPLSWHQHPDLAASQQAKHVVDRMLQRNPDKRIALSEVERMDWFTSPAPYTMEKIS